MTVETTDDRRAPIAAIIAAGLLAAGVVVQVLALASDRFQSSLNSDFLIAHFFAQALTDPTYPISAWKFGSGTFWFPDYLAYLPLRGIFGDSGLSYPAYAVAWYLTLTAVTGWTLAAAGASRWLAAAAAGLAVNLLLLCQWIPGHAIRLWELGIPAFHGGNILSGLALVALGYRSLSVSPSAVGPVKAMLLDLDAHKAEKLVCSLIERPANSSIRDKLVAFAEAEGLPLQS